MLETTERKFVAVKVQGQEGWSSPFEHGARGRVTKMGAYRLVVIKST
jgi:hypothetical protein